MRILTRTTGYCIVKSSDNEDTDVRWLDIIPQSTLQGRGILQGQEDKGCASNNGVGQLSIMQNKNEMGRRCIIRQWSDVRQLSIINNQTQ